MTGGGKAESWKRHGGGQTGRSKENFDREVVLLSGETHALVACPRCGKKARVNVLAKKPLLLCPGALS